MSVFLSFNKTVVSSIRYLRKKSHHGGPALHPFLAYLTSPLPEGVQLFLQGGVVLGEEVHLPPEGRVGRNPVFLKKTSPLFFCLFFLFFVFFIYLPRRERF